MLSSEILRATREAIYASIVTTGRAPSAQSVAVSHAFTTSLVEEAYRALADAHIIVLEPGSTDIRWAPPFSAVATAFQVRAGDASWYAPCAWDAFGIPAAIRSDALIEAHCGWSGEPLPCGVEHGGTFGDGVIHLLVPAVRFWDDIIDT